MLGEQTEGLVPGGACAGGQDLAVEVEGDTVVVGAIDECSAATGVDGDEADNNAYRAGAAYVFERTAGVWAQTAYLKASNTGALDQFGGSVAISGDTIVVGAIGEASDSVGVDGPSNDNSFRSGAAYVFVEELLQVLTVGDGSRIGNRDPLEFGCVIVAGVPVASVGTVGVMADRKDPFGVAHLG